MSWQTCLFEAKSIQEYILRSGRLRHIVGASELIEGLTGALLDDCLAALGLHEGREIRCSRRAGGAIYLFSESAEHRDAFRDLWSLVVRQYAPGLSFVLATGDGADAHAAFEVARARLDAQRNRSAAELPAGTPVTEYAPRTGRPAVRRDSKRGLQDAATARFGLDTFWRSGKLTERFTPGLDPDLWPRNLEYDPDAPPDERAFPFLPDNRYLGLLHADGNGLGQVLLKLAEQARTRPAAFLGLFRAFSEAVGQATQAAAQLATEAVLLPAREADGPIPARPIVLGGDDLTILLRADLAVPFAQSFLTDFERASRAEMAALRERFPETSGLPEALTAGCGIAFVKSNHPFHLAHGLAESLARHAKSRVRRPEGNGRIPPTLSFHRVTKASHGDYETILRDEMTFGAGDDSVRTTLEVYGADPQPQDLPALTDLQDLAGLLGAEHMARGPARQVLTLIGRNLDEARRRYGRWREVMGERDHESRERFDGLLSKLCGAVLPDLPVAAAGPMHATPLGDVATLLAVAHAGSRENTSEEAAGAPIS
jgi:hypothetical protein